MKYEFSALGPFIQELEALSLDYRMNYNQKSSDDDQDTKGVSLLLGVYMRACGCWSCTSGGVDPSALLEVLVALLSLLSPTRRY